MQSEPIATKLQETELGPLPGEWNLFPFGDLVEFECGQVDPRNEPYSSMRHVGPENIAEGSGKLLECKTASELNLISGKYLFSPRDVLYSKIRPYLRKVALPDFDGVCSADMYPLRPKNGSITREFLYCWLLSDSFTRQAISFQDRTGIPKINRQQLQATWIPLPKFDEQQAIAHVLRTVQQSKEATEKAIDAARQLKASLLRHLFTYGSVPVEQADKVPLKETEIGQIPDHWKMVRIGDFAKVGNGSTPKRDNAVYWDGGTIPWLTSAKVYDRIIQQADQHVTELACRECHLPLVKKGSVVVAITGQGKTLGNAAVLALDSCVSQHLAYIQPTNGGIVSEFLLGFLHQRYRHFREVSGGGGSTKGALTCAFLKSYPCPLPPLEEQSEIARMVEVAERKVNEAQAAAQALESLFKTLLHNLMTGKVRVAGSDN